MTSVATGATAPASSADASPVARLRELLARTMDAHDQLLRRGAPPAMLQIVRHQLAEVHARLAEHCLATGLTGEAVASALQLRDLRPGDRHAGLLAVRALLAAAEPARALPILGVLASAYPDDVTVIALLAQVQANTGATAEAVRTFRQAIALRPGETTLMVQMANAAALAGMMPDALAAFRALLTQDPDNVDWLGRYGALCNDAGAFDEARLVFGRLTQLRPERGLYHRLYGSLISYAPDDAHLAQMDGLVKTIADGGDDARELHLALFNAHESLGAYDRAFAHLARANAIRKRQLGYKAEMFERLFDTIREAFEHFEGPAPSPRTEAPVFVVGMPRSGSTLVEQILDSHPDVSAAGETPAFSALVERHLLKPDLSFDLAPLADAALLDRLGAAYLQEVSRQIGRNRRSVDKYLANFLSVGIIRAVFPFARFVHCTRNPLANCFSIYANHFETEGLGYKADMQDTARYYVRYHALMQFWRQRHSDALLDLSYEQLTLDLEGQSRRLLAHCGLGWDPACLDFHLNRRAVKTASYLQVRQPIYSGLDRRTRNYLPHLGPMIEVLGAAGLVVPPVPS